MVGASGRSGGQPPPARGDLWWGVFDPVIGSEQAGRRPLLIISTDEYHAVQDRLVIVVPVTSRLRDYASHVPLSIGSTGLDRDSFAMTEQIRIFSTQRLLRFLGHLDDITMRQVDLSLRTILDL